MPTPMSQRIYHAKLDHKDGVPRIEDGNVLVRTVGPWQTWIGEQGADVHSTKFHEGDEVLLPEAMADRLANAGAVKIIKLPRKKRGSKAKPESTKAMKPEENKSADS